MNRQLAFEELKYLRLIGGKVVYITESEALAEEVVEVNPERDRLVTEANQIKERIGVVHQMMRDDRCHEDDYHELCSDYAEKTKRLMELNQKAVVTFTNEVLARLRELETRLNAISDDWQPDDFDDYERLLAAYEKNYDLASALLRAVLDKQGYILMLWANGDKVAFASKGKEHLVPDGYIVYTDEEIRILEGNISPLIHQAKKQGAVIVGSVTGC